MTIPVLLSLGYDKEFSGAVVATAAGLGVIIPPSIPFIMYGMATGASIGKLFIAGIVLGILIAVCLMAYCGILLYPKGEDRNRIDAKLVQLREMGVSPLLKGQLLGTADPVILLGGIYPA